MCNTNKPYQHQGVLFGFFLKISEEDNKRKEKKEESKSNSYYGETMTTNILQHPRPLASPQGTKPSTQTHTISAESDLVNVFTLADHFNVHYRTAQRWTKNKWIPHYRVGKSIRYNLSEVMEAISSHAE